MTPAELAAQAAEAVRALNHATLPGTSGLEYPADAYEVTGQHEGNPAAMLAAITADLDAAVAFARRLHQALDAAQNHLTWAAAAER